jgi:death-on-curing family protein
MRKLIIFSSGKNFLGFANTVFNERKNSLIYEKNGVFWFKSKYGIPFQLEISVYEFIFNEQNLKVLEKLVALSIEDCINLTSESMGVEKVSGSINSGLFSLFTKFSYSPECDIFDFITEVFIKLLTGHYLTNGNKRFSLVYLRKLLWHFGYYLKWSSENKYLADRDYYQVNFQGRLENIVSALANNSDSNSKVYRDKFIEVKS